MTGKRGTILILRDLPLEGPRKPQDLQRSPSGVSPNTLSARLKRLGEHGVMTHRVYEQHPPRAEYLLTGKGRALGPWLAALRDWGLQRAVGSMHPTSRGLGTASRAKERP